MLKDIPARIGFAFARVVQNDAKIIAQWKEAQSRLSTHDHAVTEADNAFIKASQPAYVLERELAIAG